MNKLNLNSAKWNQPLWVWILVLLSVGALSSIIIAGCVLPIMYPKAGEAPGIGDRMGGFTAPFIGLLNAWLVYIAFWQQKKANDEFRNELKEQKEQAILKDQLDKINKYISQIKEAIDLFSPPNSESKHLKAFNEFRRITRDRAEPGRLDSGPDRQIYHLLSTIKKAIDYIETSSIPGHEKDDFIGDLRLMYHSSGLSDIEKITKDKLHADMNFLIFFIKEKLN